LEYASAKEAANLFKRLITTVIKLGSDVNDTIRQIFYFLAVQLSHYYSSKYQNKGKITNAFLEIIFVSVQNKIIE